MLSACLFMSRDYRLSLLKCLGFPSNDDATFGKTCPKVWLRSTKIPANGEGLAHKGFEHTYRIYAHMNRLHCPKVMRTRNVKQHDPIELITFVLLFSLISFPAFPSSLTLDGTCLSSFPALLESLVATILIT